MYQWFTVVKYQKYIFFSRPQKSPRYAGLIGRAGSLVRTWLGDKVFWDVRNLGHLAVLGFEGDGFCATEGGGVTVDPHLAFFPGCDHVGVAHDLVELVFGHAHFNLAGLSEREGRSRAPGQDDHDSGEKESMELANHG